MIVVQRVMTMLFAAAVLAFVLTFALKRHDYVIAGLASALFVAYVITNAVLVWTFLRTNARS